MFCNGKKCKDGCIELVHALNTYRVVCLLSNKLFAMSVIVIIDPNKLRRACTCVDETLYVPVNSKLVC